MNKPPFRRDVNKATSDDILWHCKHYTGRGVTKFHESSAALAGDMGMLVSAKDPDGGPYPAHPSGEL